MAEIGKKVLVERLLAERKISREQAQGVLEYAASNDVRVEDALIETGVLDEAALLAWLAALYQTRFVSTEKMAKAELDRATLNLIPRELAERLCVFPVVFDTASKTLAFVTPDPDNLEIARDVRAATRVQNVRPFLARPATVRAAQAKHFNGDIHAFSKVEQRSGKKNQNMFGSYGHNMFDEQTIAGNTGLRAALGTQDGPPTGNQLRAPTQADPPSVERSLVETTPTPLRNSSLLPGFFSPGQTGARDLPRRPSASQTGSQDNGVSFASSIEVQNVLVSLLENQRQELRGHSAQVSRFMQKL
ncbi:MAG TPA: hypothetical protein VFX59_30905, partial [Polyangiales bacterium]|nr:hypothetical protein [Polyangiales bacterium]